MAVIPFVAPHRRSAASIAQSPAVSRANNFDFLRLVAALSVVFSHSFLIAEGSEASEPFVRLTGNQCVLGLVGVFVFFIISGYLVTGSFLRHPDPGRFALKRVLRIFPGLAVNLLVCAAAARAAGHVLAAAATICRAPSSARISRRCMTLTIASAAASARRDRCRQRGRATSSTDRCGRCATK